MDDMTRPDRFIDMGLAKLINDTFPVISFDHGLALYSIAIRRKIDAGLDVTREYLVWLCDKIAF